MQRPSTLIGILKVDLVVDGGLDFVPIAVKLTSQTWAAEEQ